MGNAAPGSPPCPLGVIPPATWREQLPQTPSARKRRHRGHLQHLEVTLSCCLSLQSAAIKASVCNPPSTSSSQTPERVSQRPAASTAQQAARCRGPGPPGHSPTGTWRGVSSHGSCFEARRAQQHYFTKKKWVLKGEGENIARILHRQEAEHVICPVATAPPEQTRHLSRDEQPLLTGIWEVTGAPRTKLMQCF